MNKEIAYWIALAHLPGWKNLKINNLIIQFYHENKLTAEDFFQLTEKEWRDTYGLDHSEAETLRQAKEELPNTAFLAETLINEGYEIFPVVSNDYSKTLKENLKATKAPPVIYIKGNRDILEEKSLAIVGSRNASDRSLEFTDNIARIASKDYKVVVSGFAKGVDKQALDSALKYKGQSIIVLPQGIMTFGSGYQKYYKQIVEGDVLVLSVFHPKVPWRVELAMARNTVIYGLANEIFVAESSDKGGTWSGVIDGLRKNRKIFVRKPDDNERNANNLLIEKGAIPVDFTGNPVEGYTSSEKQDLFSKAGEPLSDYEKKILNLLKTGEYKVKEIKSVLKKDISESRLRDFLKSHKDVVTISSKPYRYTLKSSLEKQKKLFD